MKSIGSVAIVLIALLVCALPLVAVQQAGEYTNNFKFNSGQSIQPIFEGWSRLADGSYLMHFGYLNRNYAEQPQIAVGANNRIEPGGPDRGQPTFFYARTNRNVFTVPIPKTWAQAAELTWTVTHNGQTQRAVGWLQPEWEIDPIGGAATGGNTHPEYRNNKAPTLAIDAVTEARLSTPVTLAATVADDGLPKPRPRGKRPVGQETPPTLQMQGTVEAPVNVPAASTSRAPSRPDGLSVTWLVWRGPGEVQFEPRYVQPKDGRSHTTATFGVPGDYVLRAAAYDGAATTFVELKLNVSGSTR